jgi:P-type conjugative transfer protein TrbG
MIRPTLLLASCVLALGACAGRGAARPAATEPAAFEPAIRISEPAAPVEAPSAPIVEVAAAEMPPSPDEPAPSVPKRPSPTAQIEAANLAAVREPSRQRFVNAAQVYAWGEGALYRLYTAPERVSEIALQAGETLISVAAGDTVRWVIGDTTSGSGAARRIHILVKPSASGLRTNLIISTDRRVYHVQLESRARGAMASMSWTYPQDELLALSRIEGAAAMATPVADGVAVEALNFGYRIEGDEPEWRPIRAFDDGRQVFIEFPANLGSGEAPPLFVLGAKGGAELVNYRLRGRYYVVDRLFTAVELRLGQKRQQVVRITRSNAANRRRGRSS